MYSPVALCRGEGFCTVLNWMKLVASIDDMVLRQDTSDCLIASISFHDCHKGSIELGEDGSGDECCSEFVEGLLLCMSPSEGNIFCQVDKGACFRTVIDDESTVIVSKAQECLNLLLLC